MRSRNDIACSGLCEGWWEVNGLLNLGLPKWPQMLTTGLPVGIAQAKEIIRRTDSFFTQWAGGNDDVWNKHVRQQLKMPSASYEKEFVVYDEGPERWRASWGIIETEYVRNSWVSCAFIYGAHGWCHPDGRIGFIDNVGKWPSIEAIYNDWRAIATAFPFLDIGVTLMNGEHNEEDKRPVVSMRIREGLVTLVDPREDNVHFEHQAAEDVVGNRPILGGEIGIPKDWIDDWHAR
jgi:hypothetical protein